MTDANASQCLPECRFSDTGEWIKHTRGCPVLAARDLVAKRIRDGASSGVSEREARHALELIMRAQFPPLTPAELAVMAKLAQEHQTAADARAELAQAREDAEELGDVLDRETQAAQATAEGLRELLQVAEARAAFWQRVAQRRRLVVPFVGMAQRVLTWLREQERLAQHAPARAKVTINGSEVGARAAAKWVAQQVRAVVDRETVPPPL